MKRINTTPKRMNETEALLTARDLNESEEKHSDPEDRWTFTVEEVETDLFEVVCSDHEGSEIARW
jgi:hypothetical protein